MALPVNGSPHLIPAYYSFCRPRKDERLSWPSWLTYSGWLTHISGHPSAAGRAQDRESSPARDRRSTTMPRHQLGLFILYRPNGAKTLKIAQISELTQKYLFGIIFFPWKSYLLQYPLLLLNTMAKLVWNITAQIMSVWSVTITDYRKFIATGS